MTTPESSPVGRLQGPQLETEDAPLSFAKSYQGESLYSSYDAGRQGLDRHRVLFDKGSLFACSFALKGCLLPTIVC